MRSISSRGSPAGRRCGAIFIAALVLAACNPSPDEELRDQAGSAGSWAATLQMAGEKWLANSIPTSFVKTTCEAAGEDLDHAAREVAKSKAPARERDALRRAISQTVAAGAALRRAAESNDRPEAAQEVRRLAEIHRGFEALATPVRNRAP
jgi:hypothetical protein